MNLQTFKLVALMVLISGCFSCTNDLDDPTPPVEGTFPLEKFDVINPGEKSSSFAIDTNVVSFAVPNTVRATAYEHLPIPGYGGPNAWSPHYWRIHLFMAEGTDITSLAPIVTLAPGVTITKIEWGYHKEPGFPESEQVNYTGITDVGVQDFSKPVHYTVIKSDGSTITYKFLAITISD
ncbi:MAG: hypothetical protein LBV32_09535 [Tannerellaceae bacterium]|jgi:hypothetical protein|nr:hypothetical protein [Tannerellaceae bacterium]